jgi:hypothetical protein
VSVAAGERREASSSALLVRPGFGVEVVAIGFRNPRPTSQRIAGLPESLVLAAKQIAHDPETASIDD